MTDFSDLSDAELRSLSQQTAEWRQSRYSPNPTPSMRAPGSPEWEAKFGPTSGMGEGSQFLSGIGQGMENVGRHAGNLIGLESDQALKDSQQLDQPLMNTGAGRFGSMIGESSLIAPAMMGGEAALGARGAALMASPLLRGATEGALQGGLMGDPGSRLQSAALGGATGAVIPAALKTGNRLAYGVNRTPEAQQLLDSGVRLTPGQMNPTGVINKIEENVRGIPYVGNIVERARARAGQDFQRGVIEDAAAPGYKLQNPTTDVNDLFTEAQGSYKPLYDAAKGFPVTPQIFNQGSNTPLAQALQRAAANRTVGATRMIRQQASDFLDGQLTAFGDKAKAAGGWKSDHLIELRSRINEEIRNAGEDQAGKAYSGLLRGARDKVTDAIESQLPPDASASLKTANDAYPKLAIIRDAIKRGGDQESGFTPAQLSQAVRAATETNQYAQGGGMLRDWSSAGRDIFTERNPKTGHALSTAGMLGYAGLHHPAVVVPAAAAGLGLVGTDVGRNLVSGQTAPQLATQRLIEGLKSATTQKQRELVGVGSRTLLNRAVPDYLEDYGPYIGNQ